MSLSWWCHEIFWRVTTEPGDNILWQPDGLKINFHCFRSQVWLCFKRLLIFTRLDMWSSVKTFYIPNHRLCFLSFTRGMWRPCVSPCDAECRDWAQRRDPSPTYKHYMWSLRAGSSTLFFHLTVTKYFTKATNRSGVSFAALSHICVWFHWINLLPS